MFLAQNPYLLTFWKLAIQDANADNIRALEQSLGVFSTAEQIHMMAGTVQREKKEGAERPEGVWYPLAAIIRGTDFYKELSKLVPNPFDGSEANPIVFQGDYQPEPGEKIISLGKKSKDEFLDVMRQAGVYSPLMWRERDKALKEHAKRTGQDPNAPSETPPENIPITPLTKEEFKEIILPAMGLPPLIQGEKKPPRASKAPEKPKPPQPPVPKQQRKKGPKKG